MESEKENKIIVVGPWGGSGGAAWDDGGYNGIREITILYSLCIDSISVVYDKNGKPFVAPKRGGNGGTEIAKIKLQFPEEFLTSVSGYYCPVVQGGTPVIRSLTLKTNKRFYGPFGVETGIPFYLPMKGGQIVGFMGRGDWYIDSIGFYITPVQTIKVNPTIQSRFKALTSSISFAPRYGQEKQYKNKSPVKPPLKV